MFLSIYDPLDSEQGHPNHLGGKGHGLWWMQQNGINVPPALIIPTTMCVQYMVNAESTMAAISKALPQVVKFFTDKMGYMPLLSVRSGARVSMPGMMDTILNVGLYKGNLKEWADRLGATCQIDCYERLHHMYGSTVLGMSAEDLKLKEVPVPQTLVDQLLGSIEAVFKSWQNERAKVYRKMNNIPEEWGTAVVIQAMVFGNLNDNSGTGVLFTRNPDNGLAKVTGEFLVNAQGEDVVAGIKTPMPLEKMSDWNPQIHQELLSTVLKLETLKRDVQDVEFTIQDGVLYVLQTRNAKRSAKAALVIAKDMHTEGLISAEDVAKRIDGKTLDLACMPVIDPSFTKKEAYTGIPACSGVVTGTVVLSSKDAVLAKASGKKVILVTQETTPDDIAGMAASVGVLTMTGGSTSHAAVVARSMNVPCVVGLSQDIKLFKDGSVVSFDGATGRVWLEAVPVVQGDPSMVQAILDLIIGDKTVCYQTLPKYKHKRVLLDLTTSILSFNDTPSEVADLLDKAAKMAGHLTIKVSTYCPIYGTFVSASEFELVAATVRASVKAWIIKQPNPERFATMGWKSGLPGVTAIDCVEGLTLDDLLDLSPDTKGDFVVTSFAKKSNGKSLDDKQQARMNRVLEWLKKDGVSMTAMLDPAKRGGLSFLLYQG